jgi:hypothetical protein
MRYRIQGRLFQVCPATPKSERPVSLSFHSSGRVKKMDSFGLGGQ